MGARPLAGMKSHHDHGTRSRYVMGCRCDECKGANRRRYHRIMARDREAAASIPLNPGGVCPGVDGAHCPHGTKLYRRSSMGVCERCRRRLAWNGLVDAGPARRHLRELSCQGVGYKTAADAACVSKTTVAKIISGAKKNVRRNTRDAILEVTREAAADHALVPSGKTRMMLRDLEPEFLTKGRLAQELGAQAPKLQIGSRARVTVRTEDRVRRLHRQVIG